jgi:hypothetical protein
MRAVWRMVMLGQEGSRFWLHYDNTVLASWQAIVKGRKRFFVCPPSESEHLAELVLPKRSTGKMSRTGNSRINPFGGRDNAIATQIPAKWANKMGRTEPSSHELWAGLEKAACFDDCVEEGEILYYPHKW